MAGLLQNLKGTVKISLKVGSGYGKMEMVKKI